MNKDQTINLVHSLIKITGAVLATHGFTTASTILNSEDVVGAIVCIIGVIYSHKYNAVETK